MKNIEYLLDLVKEKKELYHAYVKDFSKEKSKPKAIQKTLKMINKK